MAKGSISLVIWDWNGTLLDDTLVCYGIANDMRRERGMPLMANVAEYGELFGFPVIDYYRRMGYTFETEPFERISEEFVRLYAERLPLCPLQPNAHETLQAVSDLGATQVLLSATSQERLLAQAEAYDLTRFFSRVIGNRDDLAFGKADYARAFLKESGVKPENALFIGDTDHDFEIASSVGCRCALLVCGHQTRAHLARLGAPLIETLSEVLPLI